MTLPVEDQLTELGEKTGSQVYAAMVGCLVDREVFDDERLIEAAEKVDYDSVWETIIGPTVDRLEEFFRDRGIPAPLALCDSGQDSGGRSCEESEPAPATHLVTVTGPEGVVDVNPPQQLCGKCASDATRAYIGYGWEFTVQILEQVETHDL